MRIELFEFEDGMHFIVFHDESRLITRSLIGYWHGDDLKGVFTAINILFFEFKIRR